MKKYILQLLFLGTITTVFSQENTPGFLMYNHNMSLFNAAFVGANNTTGVGIGFRKRQMNFNDNSATQYSSFSQKGRNNFAYGVSIINDAVFISNSTSITIDASYKLDLDLDNALYFGMKAGGVFNKLDFNSLEVNDPLFSANESSFNPIVGAGALLKGKKYFLHLGAPNLLQTNVQLPKEDNNGNLISEAVKTKLQVYFGGGYDFTISDNFVLSPQLFSRFEENNDLLLDLSLKAEISRKIDLGITYRKGTSVIGSFVFKGFRNTNFGYAYEATTSDFKAQSSGAHEFIIRFIWL